MFATFLGDTVLVRVDRHVDGHCLFMKFSLLSN